MGLVEVAQQEHVRSGPAGTPSIWCERRPEIESTRCLTLFDVAGIGVEHAKPLAEHDETSRVHEPNPYESPRSESSSSRLRKFNSTGPLRFFAFALTVALSAIAGLVAGAATLLTQDVGDDSVVFLFGYFGAWGGGFGVAAGFLANLLVVNRASPLQVLLVFGGVTALLVTILWNPNARPVALQLIVLSLAQPLLCIPIGLVLRRIAAS